MKTPAETSTESGGAETELRIYEAEAPVQPDGGVPAAEERSNPGITLRSRLPKPKRKSR